ncbi:GmrSD restriction endonuclease domain-containing protein [Anaerosacchariphilus polymeriproducens]|nr:DUF262 domain-containing protein [Anaerosacchariphilus polymeriproducens]
MKKQPVISGKVVERAYEEYRGDTFLVNRRYQRKLVWGQEEKKAFIDSLVKGYPIPLFLFSKATYKEIQKYEIIDGMQRLNALFSYIENAFSNEEGEYFDLQTTALTKSLAESDILVQRTPIMDRDICVKLVSYELPFSIYEENDSKTIDEVFRRINSNGQHLSRQEIRQAGATGEFAQLVRRMATIIRGDVSHEDILLLPKISEISIGKDINGKGIEPADVFWVKENIIKKEDLRQSMDEEVIADLIAGMIISPIPPSRLSTLDSYYGFNSEDISPSDRRIEQALASNPPEKIQQQFIYIYDEIKKIFHNRKDTLIEHIVNKRVYKGPRYFQVLFLALYRLLIVEERVIIDYDTIYNQLDKISSRTINISGGGGAWSGKEKNELITATAAVLKGYTKERTETDPMYYSYTTELETLLRQSKTENSQYDFKQGIHDLKTGELNEGLINKIFKTLTAMGNSEKGAVGYVILGVADNENDEMKISTQYDTKSVKVGNFFVSGLEGEIDAYYKGNTDKYFSMIKSVLEKQPLTEHYRRQIGSKIRLVDYFGKTVIIIKIVNDNGAVMYDNNYYTRICANNDAQPVSAEAMPAFFAKFM